VASWTSRHEVTEDVHREVGGTSRALPARWASKPHKRSRGAVVLIGVLLGLGASTARGSPEEESLRAKLIAAYSSASVIHIALKWRIARTDVDTRVVISEAFRRKHMAGVRVFDAMSGEELLYAATDGKTAWWGESDAVTLCTEGADSVNSHMRPYLEGCRLLADLWECPQPSAHAIAPTFALGPGAEGRLSMGLRLVEGGVPSWLATGALEGVRRMERVAEDRVLIESPTASIMVRTSDGMPVSVTEHTKIRSATAEIVDPAWTDIQWEESILSLARARSEGPAWQSSCLLAGRGVLQVVRWFLEDARGTPMQGGRMWQLAALGVSVDVEMHGGEGLLEEGDAASRMEEYTAPDGSKLHPKVEQLLREVGRSLRTHIDPYVRNVGWTHREVEELLEAFMLAYRVHFYSIQRCR